MGELKLPELGEGIDIVEVSGVMVAVGDFIRRDQPVIEVETEKASLEVPSLSDGKVVDLRVKAGDQIRVGETILTVEIAASPGAEAPTPARDSPGSPDPQVAVAEPEPPPTMEAPAAPSSAAAAPTASPSAPEAEAPVIDFPVETSTAGSGGAPGVPVPAAPSTRALARELGVPIASVPGSGPGGRISRNDVKAYAKKLIVSGATAAGAASSAPAPGMHPPLPDFDSWGKTRRESLSNIRRATVRAMSTAWSTVPHVTQFDQSDITQLESMRKRFNRRPEAADRKLSMTAIVIKMAASILRQYPKFNASLDVAGDAVIFKDYFHIGVAVDTERGLLVPVIRDVDTKSLVQVTREVNELAQRARDKKSRPDELKGATFTVTNLGGLGTTYFSPIVNWPEVSILGVGRAQQQAIFEEGQFQPRLILPLSLSYDHRLIDGADAARFLRKLAEALEQPLLLLLDE